MADPPRSAAALDLASLRMPPPAGPAEQTASSTLEGLLSLLPKGETKLGEELVEKLEQPLEGFMDEEAGRPFLLTPYNRDGDAHRSPWSNKYYPPVDAGADADAAGEDGPYLPPDSLRALEVEANELWEVYRELYYSPGEALGSVYLWECEDAGPGGFAGCFAIQKRIKEGPGGLREGSWDALHVVEALPSADGRSATYKLTSTVLLGLAVRHEASVGALDVSGSITRQTEASHPLASGAGALPPASQHLAHMGQMIEGLEIQIRGDLDSLYLQRTRETVHAMRQAGGGGGGGGEAHASDSVAAAAATTSAPKPRRPPAGGIALPGLGGAGAGGPPAGLFEAINRRKQQKAASGQDDHIVEG